MVYTIYANWSNPSEPYCACSDGITQLTGFILLYFIVYNKVTFKQRKDNSDMLVI